MSSQDLTEYRYGVLFHDDKEEPISNILKGLAELGLTHNEAKVYTYLAKCGAKKAIEVSKALNIPRTETYHLLARLQSKGLIMITMQHPIKYIAKPFEETISILIGAIEEKVKDFERKKDRLLIQWNSLPEFAYDNEDDKDKLQILEGKSSVYAKARELCVSAKNKLLILANEKELLRFYHYEVLDDVDAEISILTNISKKFINILDDVDAEISIKEELDAPCFIIKDYEEMLMFMDNENSKDVVALWTNCSALIQSMRLLFNKLYD
ncbi:MAG: hypothetical protein KatS3mg003_0073 [Candidatus Nitrosocaldaceae archaeon]|nr:MAG: hypothetical protein KatS3mg003_0073 [Candidatus Nitrosocaldaceae archaeon]